MYGKNKSTNEKATSARAKRKKHHAKLELLSEHSARVEHTKVGAQETANLRPLVVIRAPIFCMGVRG